MLRLHRLRRDEIVSYQWGVAEWHDRVMNQRVELSNQDILLWNVWNLFVTWTFFLPPRYRTVVETKKFRKFAPPSWSSPTVVPSATGVLSLFQRPPHHLRPEEMGTQCPVWFLDLSNLSESMKSTLQPCHGCERLFLLRWSKTKFLRKSFEELLIHLEDQFLKWIDLWLLVSNSCKFRFFPYNEDY